MTSGHLCGQRIFHAIQDSSLLVDDISMQSWVDHPSVGMVHLQPNSFALSSRTPNVQQQLPILWDSESAQTGFRSINIGRMSIALWTTKFVFPWLAGSCGPSFQPKGSHELHENCHSVTFYFMKKKDSRRCCDITMPESIHTKDESKLRFSASFHLWCELTTTINVTEWQVSWNSCHVNSNITRWTWF